MPSLPCVGDPHDAKGQGIDVYVTLKASGEASDALRDELRAWVHKDISPLATPEVLQEGAA